MKSLVDEGIVDPTLFNDTAELGRRLLLRGSVCSMGLVGPWVIADYAEDFPEVAAATQYVPLPTLGEQPTFVADSGWGLTVSSDSPEQELAWDFVQYAPSTRRPRAAVEPRHRHAAGSARRTPRARHASS